MTVATMDALDLGLQTQYSIAAESACPGGCAGGIIQEMDASTLHRLAPNINGYDPKEMSILWTYNFVPSHLRREDDMFDSRLIVFGKVGATGTFYATPVKNYIALPLCPIEYRNENSDAL